MQRRYVLAVLAGLIALAAGYVDAFAAESYGYRDRWYQAYERHREAAEKRRARYEIRLYERMANRRYADYGYGGRGRYYDYDRYGGRYHSYRRYYTHRRYYGLRRNYYNCAELYGYDSCFHQTRRQLNDHRYSPEDYPAGWGAWWTRIDRAGRGGQN